MPISLAAKPANAGPAGGTGLQVLFRVVGPNTGVAVAGITAGMALGIPGAGPVTLMRQLANRLSDASVTVSLGVFRNGS